MADPSDSEDEEVMNSREVAAQSRSLLEHAKRAGAFGNIRALDQSDAAWTMRGSFEFDYLRNLQGVRDNLNRLPNGDYASRITQRLWVYWQAARNSKPPRDMDL